MTETSSTKRDNNFGALRLLFAIFVVVAHSAILIDGNNTREMLTRLCGTTSLGPVGVDGFFLVSGYLITQSFVSRDGIATYLRKRVLRIVPGYAACFLLCVFVLAPLVGGTLTLPLAGDQIARMSFLMWPAVPDVFPGLHYRTLDGSMWTIGYEARCYLATALLGSIGLFEPRARLVLVPAVMALLALHATGLLKDTTIAHEEIFGEIGKSVRLFGVYGAGALFFLFRERIPLTGRGAFVATLLLVPSLFSAVLSEAAVAVFGGYILFWFALKVRVPLAATLRRRPRHLLRRLSLRLAHPERADLRLSGNRSPWPQRYGVAVVPGGGLRQLGVGGAPVPAAERGALHQAGELVRRRARTGVLSRVSSSASALAQASPPQSWQPRPRAPICERTQKFLRQRCP